MLTPHQGFTYNKFDKPNDWPELSSTFDYKIEDGKLFAANENIKLSGPVGYTVVGSPTIVNGLVSEFSSNNTIQINNFNASSASWEFVIKAKRGSGGGNAILCIGNGQPMFLYFSSARIRLSVTGTNTDISGTFDTNAFYYIRVRKEQNVCYLDYSADGVNYIGTVSTTVDLSSYTNYTISFGRAPYYYTTYFGGTIDLNNTYIKVNNQLWFGQKHRQYEASNGVVTKNTVPVPEGLVIGNFTTPSNGMFDIVTQTFEPFEYYPIIKTDSNMLQVESIQYGEGIKPEAKLVGPVDYTVVGSPTITNGVASGFSNSNYLATSQAISFDAVNDNYEIVSKFKPIETSWTSITRYLAGYGTSSARGGICITPFKHYYAYIYNDGNTSITIDGGADDYINNRETWCKLSVANKVAIISKSLDGISWVQLATKDLSEYTGTYTISGAVNIGIGHALSYPWIGSIDLNNTYINVNGTLWFGKENWTPCIFDDNSIVEFTGHKADYSSYNTYAFKPTIQNSGTYDVWIDNQKVYENVTSATQTDINWNNLALTTGYSVTTPEALKAHILKITPSNKENKFTTFRHAVSSYTSSGTETTGVLQIHFELDNELNLTYLTNQSSSIDTSSSKLQAVTSKTNELKITGISAALSSAVQLKRLPKLNLINNPNISQAFQNTQQLKYVDMTSARTGTYTFNSNYLLEKIDGDLTVNESSNNFANVRSLKQLPNITSITTNSLPTYITNASSLQPTDIDLSNKDDLTKLDIYGTSSYRIDGLKSLKVSNEAPFDGASPQINVSYTGLERNALVELFNSLPTVSNGQTIDITGCTGASSLTNDEIAIATNKGWTVTGAS